MGLAENLLSLQQRIEAACRRAGRDAASVTLLAVSKGMPPEVVQEARAKIPLCPGRLHWHMIGHLQSNKCRDAVQLFEMIQGVDSLELARELDKWAGKYAKTMPILLEVNLAGESTRFGFTTEQILADLGAINSLRRLEVHGLMTMAPWTQDPEKVRPLFRRLRRLKVQCEENLGAALQH